MKRRIIENFPLIITVGQVVIFPYYIIWLKEISYTYTLFAWFFAGFSFSAAWGYRVYHSRKNLHFLGISFIYFAMGIIYVSIYFINVQIEVLPYFALIIQVLLGFLQGYFRAWHVEQSLYKLQAVHHYLLVGVCMIGLSFIKILSPVAFLTSFGVFLLTIGIIGIIQRAFTRYP
ncbi:hypothetical protein [Metabacillus niabensis]|uniref:hypothetical protein n=1 Tax=Metabacillus niabensis TaxID=324854 RepID=UPI001CFC1469|nr:hypothetical protein [Metabacillus niabensis]